MEAATYFPIVKLSQGKYLIGTKEKTLQINNNGVIVRTGGGFMYLEEYLRHYSRSECIELNNLLQKNNCPFSEMVVNLMKKHNADKRSIAAYQRKCSKQLGE